MLRSNVLRKTLTHLAPLKSHTLVPTCATITTTLRRSYASTTPLYALHPKRPHAMPSVPTTAQVQPGAAVSIVLKADQRTGRQVQGTVQDLLSRGNHPRGIKVRLRDGRVGRVQRMAASSPASATSRAVDASAPALAGEGAYGDETHGEGMQVRREGSGMQRVRHRDVRLEEDSEMPREELDLAAYIKPARRKKGRKGAEGGGDALEQGQAAVGSAGVTAKCPVCGEFEGDEAAVAHHVEAHFTEAPCG